MADEVCLQMHLLNLSFVLAVRARASDEQQARDICTKQLIGLAGLAAERIKNALALPDDLDGVLQVLELHPLLNPAGYVDAEFEGGRLHVHRSPPTTTVPGSRCAHRDPPGRCRRSPPPSTRMSRSASTAPTPTGPRSSRADTAAKVSSEVEVIKFSGGATFVFEPRRSLPLTVV